MIKQIFKRMLVRDEVKAIRKELEKSASRLPVLFNALGDPMRFSVFQLLMKHRGICVSDIASILEVSVPAASYQLKMLEMVGLIRRERQGKMVCYRIRDDDPLVTSVMRMTQES